MPNFIETVTDVAANVLTLHAFTRGNEAERKFSRRSLKNGKLFVALAVDGGYLFAPSKFAGYKNNGLHHTELLDDRDGRDTNVEISRILKGSYIGSGHPTYKEIDRAYLAYCESLSIQPSKHHLERRYWPITTPTAEVAIRYPDEIERAQLYFEGARIQTWVNRYERDGAARTACIQHYGVQCSVCDFLFEKFYGDIGVGYIHVHHLVAMSSIGEGYRVDPVDDLRPVCANCHAMLHRGKEVRSIEELKLRIRASRRG